MAGSRGQKDRAEGLFQTVGRREAAVEPQGWVYACLKKSFGPGSLAWYDPLLSQRVT
jgi:hypothetical protein